MAKKTTAAKAPSKQERIEALSAELGEAFDVDDWPTLLECADALKKLSPTSEEAFHYRAIALTFLARHKDAVTANSEALAQWAKYFKRFPNDFGSEDPRGINHYYRACALACLGRNAEALEDLRAAIAIDASFGRSAKKDAEFKKLSKSPEFKAVVSGAKSEPRDAKADLLAEGGPVDELVEDFDGAGAPQFALDDLGDLLETTIKRCDTAKKRGGPSGLDPVLLGGFAKSEALIRKHIAPPSALLASLRRLFVAIADGFDADALAAQIRKHEFSKPKAAATPNEAPRKAVKIGKATATELLETTGEHRRTSQAAVEATARRDGDVHQRVTAIARRASRPSRSLLSKRLTAKLRRAPHARHARGHRAG